MIQQPTTNTSALACSGLAVVRLLASQRPRELLVEFRQQLLHKLARRAEMTGDDPRVRQNYRQAYDVLGNDQNRLIQDVFHYLHDTLEQFLCGTLEGSEAAFRSGSSLSLMGAELLEEQALITAMRQRTDSHYQELLWPLCKRLACLGRGTSDVECNPLAPVRFCLALRYGLDRAGIVPAVKRDIYYWFEGAFLSHLGDFYQQLNDGLAVAGINPDTGFDVVKSRYQAVDDVAGETVVPTPEQQQVQPHSNADASEANEHSADTLLQQLGQLLGGGSHLELYENHRQTIELVDSALREFSHNTRLSSEIKAVLSLLHMPLLKVALADPVSFRQPGHPARQLLVQMIEAATDWLQGSQREFGVFQQIRDVVERLLRNGGVCADHFAEELLVFRDYIRQLRLNARRQASIKRRTGLAEGVLKHRIGKQQLPEALDRLLNDHWQGYLNMLRRELGSDFRHNSRWRDALSVVDDLLWGVGISPDNRNECKRWRQHYLWLEAVLASGLDHLQLSSGQCQQILSSVRQVYKPLLEEGRHREATVKTLQDTEQEAQAFGGGVTEPVDEAQWLRQLKKIPSGTWFRFASGRREQLVWRNLRTMQFQFCESAGGKSVMRTGDDMARLLAEGIVQLDGGEAAPVSEPQPPLQQFQ